MKTIWKVDVAVQDEEQEFSLPQGATFIDCGVTATTAPGHVSLWATVDTFCPMERVTLRVVGTGQQIYGGESWVGTSHSLTAALVWHIVRCFP